jgi:hypothetical protein
MGGSGGIGVGKASSASAGVGHSPGNRGSGVIASSARGARAGRGGRGGRSGVGSVRGAGGAAGRGRGVWAPSSVALPREATEAREARIIQRVFIEYVLLMVSVVA